MASQKGIFKIEGTLDDVTFYKRGDSFLVRNKGGISKQRLLNDPAFARTRENNNEFKNVVTAGKLLRDSNAVLCRKAYDGELPTRLVRVLSKVKNLDTTSGRGDRTVQIGLVAPEAQNLLKGFEFNSRSVLSSVLQAPYVLDTLDGSVTITDLIPEVMLRVPQNSSTVTFKTAVLNINFETAETAITYSPDVTLPLDMTVSSPVITPTAMPVGSGYFFYFLLVEFSQTVNGISYPLHNGSFNSLTLLLVK